MEQYIPKSAVLAEIERIMAEEMSFFKDCCKDGLENTSSPVVYTRMEMLLSFLNTLEVKDMDEVIKTAEDHAYFAGSENAREKLIDNNISLSTDVDEAAKEYLLSIDAYRTTDYGCKFNQFDIETFKAGAEWMAKQGETLYDYINVDGKNQRWLGENLLQGDYDAGQAVIVQIRKV